MGHRAAQRRPDSPTFVACVPTSLVVDRVCGQVFPDEILGVVDGKRRSIVRGFRGVQKRRLECRYPQCSRARSTLGDLPGDGAATTFPMGFAYLEAYGAARSCLGARAGMSVPDGRRGRRLGSGVANLRRHREDSLSGPCRGPDTVGNQRIRWSLLITAADSLLAAPIPPRKTRRMHELMNLAERDRCVHRAREHDHHRPQTPTDRLDQPPLGHTAEPSTMTYWRDLLAAITPRSASPGHENVYRICRDPYVST